MIFRDTSLSLWDTCLDRSIYRRLARRTVRALAMGLSVTQVALGLGFSDRALAQQISPTSGEAFSSKAVATQQLADLLPAETPMAFFFSSDAADWEALQQFELFARLAVFTDSFVDDLARSGEGLDAPYRSDSGARWQGDQFVVAALPDRSPRSIAATDIDKEMVSIIPIADESALAPYKETLETSRTDAPEKSRYLDVELWVWPTEERSFDSSGEWEDNRENLPDEDLPDVPHEDWPPADEASEFDESAKLSKAELPAARFNQTPLSNASISKALNTDSPAGRPSPEDFGIEENYGTFTVKGKAIAFLNGYVIQATEPETIKKLLNYREFDYARLSDNPLFKRSEYGQEAGAIARLYADLSEVSKHNIDGSQLPSRGVPSVPGLPRIPGIPRGLPRLPATPSLIMRQETQAQIASALKGITVEGIVYPQAEGIRLQGRIYGNNLLRSNPTPDLDYADSALEFVPAATYSFNSGRDISGIWRQLARSLSLNESTREYLQQARDFVKTATGLDLDTELIGWMDREFVLFFFPSRKGALNSLSPGLGVEVGVAIQTSDRPTAQNTLDTIDALLSLFAQPTTINGTPAVSWQAPTFGTNPEAPPSTSYVSHSWISEDTLIITSGTDAMAQLLNPVAFAPISEHPTFLNATDTLAKPNNGYGYFNAGSSFSLIYGLVTQWLEIPADDPFFQTVKSYLGTIRGAGSTTSSTAEYWQLDSLLNLAPAEARPPEVAETSIPQP